MKKMNASVNHLIHELASIRAGRANPAILDKVTVDYYGSPTPSSRSRCRRRRGPHPDHLPWDRSMLKPISKAIQTSDIGINPLMTARSSVWCSRPPPRSAASS